MTLCLVMFGGALFPIPFAFAQTGVALGVFAVVVVAALNAYTCTMLLRAALGCHELGLRAADGATLSFEALAGAVGGTSWLIAARASLVVLLFGTNCGGLAVIGEAGGRTACTLGVITGGRDDDVTHHCGSPPRWLTRLGVAPLDATPERGGALLSMALLTTTVLLPLCVKRDITSLNKTGAVGLVLLFALVFALVRSAIVDDVPSARAMGGDAFVWSVKPGIGFTQAFPILGYALYVHPVLLPMLSEMTAASRRSFGVSLRLDPDPGSAEPSFDRLDGIDRTDPNASSASSMRSYPGISANTRDGATGIRAAAAAAAAARLAAVSLERSVTVSLVFAVAAYSVVGICGYGSYGESVQKNVLLSLQSPSLDAAMVLYQSLCFPPTFHSLRATAYDLLDARRLGESPEALLDDAARLEYDSDGESRRLDGSGFGFERKLELEPPFWTTHVPRVLVMLTCACAVAAFLPRSETLFAITGSIGVCAVCYAFPICVSRRVRALVVRRRRDAAETEPLARTSGDDWETEFVTAAATPTVPSESSRETPFGFPRAEMGAYAKHDAVSSLALVFGIAVSVLGLYATFRDAFRGAT